MKYSFSSSFTRLTWSVSAVILLLTIAGGIVSKSGPTSACPAWTLCLPGQFMALTHLVHLGLAGIAAVLMAYLFAKAWREQRDEPILLPLTTVTAILYFGEAFVGLVEMGNGFPLHLVILHAFSAVSVWIALAALVLASGYRAQDGKSFASAGAHRRLKDFVTLGKPWIVALLLLTTLGGLVVGGRAWPTPQLALWTMLGGALAAGGSSALNQYIDRDLDKNMQRTANRPLAAGRLAAPEGLAFGLGLCLISYYLLADLVNVTAALLSLAGIFYYVIFYSLLLKKATVQNIVIGGGAGAIPPMVGWAAATGHLSLAAWILFLIIFMWTPPHFWALAIVRLKDYERAGVPMLPVVKGERTTRVQILVYTLVLVGITLLLPVIHATGPIYLVSALLLGMALIVAAWRVFTIPGNKVAWTMYRWSSMYLALIFLALMVDAVVS